MARVRNVLESRVVYDGKIFQAVVERVRLPDRDRDSQVEIVRTPGSVVDRSDADARRDHARAAVPAPGRRLAVGAAGRQHQSRRGRRDGGAGASATRRSA